MPSEPLLTSFFGAGFTQNATSLTVLKADLNAPVGLTPTYEFIPALSNGAESTALALFLRWGRNQDQSTDSQFIIKPFEMTLEFRFNKWQRKYTSVVEIWQDDNVSTSPNPNLI